MNINKAFVYGNLTRDPELKTLPSGVAVTSFGLATNRVYNDRDGKRQEQTEFHNIVVFGKQAETVSKFLSKGSGAFVEGRLQTRSWEQDGVKRYMTEIIADRVQFGPRSGGGAPDNNGGSNASPAASNDGSPSAQSPKMPEYPEEEINPEDIPF